jgi:hypothetical protein
VCDHHCERPNINENVSRQMGMRVERSFYLLKMKGKNLLISCRVDGPATPSRTVVVSQLMTANRVEYVRRRFSIRAVTVRWIWLVGSRWWLRPRSEFPSATLLTRMLSRSPSTLNVPVNPCRKLVVGRFNCGTMISGRSAVVTTCRVDRAV